MKATRKKLSALRALMESKRIDAYLIPSTDAHLNEYVPACWRRRAWLSGFTGSAGELVVRRTKAGLWTDGRYFLQAEQQLADSGIELFRMGEPDVPTIEGYLCSTLRKGQRVGIDPRVVSIKQAAQLTAALNKCGIKLILIERNLVDCIWDDQPELPSASIELLPVNRCGEATSSKLARIREKMKQARVDAHVLTALDAIAWTFNLRGTDVEYNPVAIAYAVITMKDAWLFIDPSKVPSAIARKLETHVHLFDYDEVGAKLQGLAKRKARVWIDDDGTNLWIGNQLKGCERYYAPSPVAAFKAVKNKTEIDGMRKAHVRDGVAMVKFLRWINEAVKSGEVTELSAEAKLDEFRSENPEYRGPSFRTIAVYGPHGAIIHYSASEASSSTIEPRGVLLLDSGGQYVDGTTDITRTISLGDKPSAAVQRAFTLVLRGHIALARAKFPPGVRGMRLDTLARMYLWADGKDYNHGTGHGVGAFLNVHEGPQSLSPLRCHGAHLEPGNILSNEPGYYVPGEFGIRTENLVLVVEDKHLSKADRKWLAFDTLTLCPIDTRLVDASLMAPQELAWLNDYHTKVKETLTPLLEQEADRNWLANACKPIGE